MNNTLVALSFGGGRQTTAMLILAVKGEIPRPDVLIFADTGCEWPETYSYIEQYIKPFCAENKLPFVTVRRKDTLYDWLSKANALPLAKYRTCTDQFKVRPILKHLKPIGIETEQIGFSFDEAGRSFNKKKFPLNRIFPLIEQRITLHDCQYEIEHFNWPLPVKSACYLCCNQNVSRIARLALNHPDLFDKLRDLEIRAHKRTGYYLLGEHPITAYGAVEQLAFGEPETTGCAEGYCFR